MGLERLALPCGLPQDALSSGARVTMHGRVSVLIEGQRGVVEMSGARIRLRTADGVLCVLGQGMELRELSADAALIAGEMIETATYARGEIGREG